MFFDEHPRFLETSETAAGLDRLNLRHEAIITDNADVLRGARVLDIASHDGRWSYAALQAGASHVIGIEARPNLVDNARRNLVAEGASPKSYDLVCADVFERLGRHDLAVDVVLCLGFLYHTTRYSELFSGIRATGARHVIIDTAVLPPNVAKPMIDIVAEHSSHESNAVADRYSHRGRTLVGTPSVAAIDVMLAAYEFDVEKRFDWAHLLELHPGARQIAQYRRQNRITIRAVRRPMTERVTSDLRRSVGRSARKLFGDAAVNRLRRLEGGPRR